MNSKTITNDIEVVRNYFAALGRGDLPACGALLADDVTVELGHDLAHGLHAVAALHDLARAAVELDHALGVEQHMAQLRFFVLQAEAARQARALGQVGLLLIGGLVVHGHWHAFSMASSMVHRMSSLNCRMSSARCWAARVVKWSSVTRRPWSTSRPASGMRLRK